MVFVFFFDTPDLSKSPKEFYQKFFNFGKVPFGHLRTTFELWKSPLRQ